MTTRRSFLKAGLGLLSLSTAGALTARAGYAAAPFAKTQAPAFYRMALGDIEVTALSDGTLPVPLEKFFNNTTPDHVDAVLRSVFLESPVDLSVNAYLFNTGSRLILIDAGTGGLLGPRLGHLVANLRAAGYEPEQIDDVVLTHIHADHSGGLTHAGKPVFPNALVHVNKRDAEYWLDPANLASAPEAKKTSFHEATTSLKPYVDAGRFRIFADNASPIPGFGSILRPGHTPGHSSIVIESKGERFVVWGDISHGDAVQFDEPDIAIDFDVDSQIAANTRRHAFVHAADHGYWVAGAHLPFPGIGHVRADSDEFDWVPVNYSAAG
ncbi:MBL fold metallo-hydrolase [Phyllobacterium salinisoli]|uniref:MBL fold metallo-hydrolase n=1 Tax=Phyllobacterium salinisoli TaxID=1899321 RepID=A0A368JZJ9_9HYPH|nr:MBL fold metallo-hydrolase [Phyllobacterium salinisoli]RCS22586.1 MBL fold metallo-hydrolase [Phyllobacterium salinisoli]